MLDGEVEVVLDMLFVVSTDGTKQLGSILHCDSKVLSDCGSRCEAYLHVLDAELVLYVDLKAVSRWASIPD